MNEPVFSAELFLILVLVLIAVIPMGYVFLSRGVIRAAERGTPCRQLRRPLGLTTKECLKRLTGVAAPLKGEVVSDGGRTLLVMTLVSAAGKRKALRKYVYEVSFEPAVLHLHLKPKTSRGHAVSEEAMAEYLNTVLK